MHKIFLAVSSMIVADFLMKSWKKLHEKPTIDKDEIYRQIKKKAEYDARRAAARPVIAKLDSISTPRDGEKWMVSIVDDLRDMLRQCYSVDGCDAMAMAPGRFS